MKTKYMFEKNGKLYLQNYALSEIAHKYQTPLYVFDERYLDDLMDEYKINFKSNNFSTEVVYASKAFLVPTMCDLVKKHDMLMDAVSLGDLMTIKEANFPLSKVVFHGNNKSIEEIEYAIDNQIGLIVVDNIKEMALIENIASNKNKTINILFRFNPGINAHTHRYIKTALYDSKFGESIDDDDKIKEIVNLYQTCKHLNLIGCHSHIGSQILSYKPFLLNIDKMMNFMKKINEQYNLSLSWLDLGGGFGIYYENNIDIELNNHFKINDLLKKMIKRIELNSKKMNIHLDKVLIEPGRSIVGPTGCTLYQCGYLKETMSKKKYLFIDGGMSDNIRPALYQAKYEVDLVDKMDQVKEVLVDIAGKCCESGDIIAHNVLVPIPEDKDIMIVYNTGAYNYSMFINYNGMTKPAVVFVNKDLKIVSRRETNEEIATRF